MVNAFRRYLSWRERTARPPIALGVRAARWGAAACVVAAALLVIPISRGWADARAMLSADPDLCGAALPMPPEDGRSDLRRAVAVFAVQSCDPV